MKYILYTLGLMLSFILLLMVNRDNADNAEYNVQLLLEYAYYEGQRDALTGNVCIVWDDEVNDYVLVKTPWNNGRETIFDSTKHFTEQLKR